MMRNILPIALLILTLKITFVQAQNIGIGTNNPEYKLDVAGNLRLQKLNNDIPGILLDGPTSTARSLLGSINDGNVGILGNSGAGWGFSMNVTNGNIGFGNVAPTYELDIKGRIRIQSTPNNSAGIYFNGSNATLRSFMGNISDDYVGLYGYGGAGWNIAMNAIDGNVGIGTSSPTSEMDVNGSIRLRSSFPKKGSTLQSADASGNSSWEDPILFKAVGLLDDEPLFIPESLEYTKVYFNQYTSYNHGAAYQPNNSQFVVPTDGVYHFECVLDWLEYEQYFYTRIVLNRNGNIYEIALNTNGGDFASTNNGSPNGWCGKKRPSQLFTDVSLITGDIIWVEARVSNYSNYPSDGSPINNNSFKTWFTGRLISKV